ncbi:MAG TPA: FHA domain-containing protein [Micromonosporaceae bacterium]|nr:FHA domain-containing protein [Micromonosporaceae bacterium]
MRVCPKGHRSQSDDYCNVCGAAIAGPAAAAAAPRLSPTPASPPQPQCRACGNLLDGRYCEHCGHDSLSTGPAPKPQHPPTAATSWCVIAAADRAYFDAMRAMDGPDADLVDFPLFCPERRFPLQGDQVLVGRRNPRRGVDPEIDLTGPPEDVGVSHTHAMLVAQPDGGWTVVDLGSANGTYVNGDHTTPIRTNTPVAIGHGDRVHVGAWTRLTLYADRGDPR